MGEGDYPVGLATIQGYYTSIERLGFGDNKQICDSFVITGGSDELIRSVLSLVNSGNGVYLKNERNQPVVSLDMNVLRR